MTIVCVPTVGPPEILPPPTVLQDVVEKVSVMEHPLTESTTMYWSSLYGCCHQVNEYGTRIVGCLVHGDVFISTAEAIADQKLEDFLSRLHGRSPLKNLSLNHSTRSEQYLQQAASNQRKSAMKLRRTGFAQHLFQLSDDSIRSGKRFESPTEDSTKVKTRKTEKMTEICVPWCTLHEDIFSLILKQLMSSTKDLISVSGVCKKWRENIFEDQSLLTVINFRLNLKRPFLNSTQKLLQVHVKQSPGLLSKAVLCGNVKAMRCYGLMLDEVHLGHESLALWQRLMNLSDMYGCWKMGEILYQSRPYMPANLSDAFFALSRAAKKALAMEDCPEKSLVLNKVGIYLGYCFFDGDGGQKQNNETAVYWFRLSAQHGNADAERVCGWIFNTGMYG